MLPVKRAEIDEGLFCVWKSPGHGLKEEVVGVAELLLVEQNDRQIQIRHPTLGIQLNRLLQCVGGILQFPLAAKLDGEVVVIRVQSVLFRRDRFRRSGRLFLQYRREVPRRIVHVSDRLELAQITVRSEMSRRADWMIV